MRLIPAGSASLRIPTRIVDHAAAAADYVAAEVAALIRTRAKEGRPCVLGLPTGSTPLAVYARLIALYQAGELSFTHVVTFNLDEYHPMVAGHAESYHRFMWTNLFSQIDIKRENVHIPRGDLPAGEVAAHADAYERAITAAGGIDLMLLGIGRNGHIGFNEPGAPRGSRTRQVYLDRVTRRDAAKSFGGEANVPRCGVTMGVASILACRRVILVALGEAKAPAIAQASEGPITPQLPASFLQDHGHAELVLDAAASAQLTAVQSPWLAGPVTWDERTIRAAVTQLSLRTAKPILKLTEGDYHDHQLHELVAAHGPVHDLNVGVFRALTASITGWPGGKPPHRKRPGDIDRPRDDIFPKRCLILSPHPDDDVISMGGTLLRLVDQGHEVHVAYQTSGSNAVFDDDVRRHLEFLALSAETLGLPEIDSARILSDRTALVTCKARIRRTEALAAGRECGLAAERLHFLDLPFYNRRGAATPVGEDDIAAMVALYRTLRPHQIYAAGDLRDPHGTHRLCLDIALEALRRCRGDDWLAHCDVLLYRGAWEEWQPHEADLAVPLSPDDVLRKRHAIFRHQSQKDRVMFPGEDAREFWQRAEERSRASAATYRALGLADYEAIEAFARWHDA